MRILVTGGAGFIGSHLIDRLMAQNHHVICLDNLFTGTPVNIAHWQNHDRFEFIQHDVIDPIDLQVEQIYHLACPASPVHYQHDPIKTLKTSVMGTLHMLELATKYQARLLLASTSEVYGDPLLHPQTEDYWGNVNCTGIRACYDEGKRVAETLTFDFHRQHNTQVRVARIFNTYGPRMLENDGRVVSNFICQGLRGEDLTVYGDGSQTRSFCYVSDLVEGLIALMASDCTLPVNLGNPAEYTILELTQAVQQLVGTEVGIAFKPLPQDDPQRRRPDISRAKTILNWQPIVPLMTGLSKTIEDFRSRI